MKKKLKFKKNFKKGIKKYKFMLYYIIVKKKGADEYDNKQKRISYYDRNITRRIIK